MTSPKATTFTVQFPSSILLDLDLSANELRLFGIIQSMDYSTKNVFYSNATLAKMLNVQPRSIPRMNEKLKAKGYITREFDPVQKRHIWRLGDDVQRHPLKDDVQRHPPHDVQRHPINNNLLDISTTSSVDSKILTQPQVTQLLEVHRSTQDQRSPDEFMRQAEHHMQESIGKGYKQYAAFAGLFKLVKSTGGFQEPAGYKTKNKPAGIKPEVLYSNYLGEIKRAKNFKEIPITMTPLTYEEWYEFSHLPKQ